MRAKQFLDNKTCNVLVVDDDAMVLSLISRSLKGAGCVVSACSTAAQALECLEKNTFNVLLLDIRMPDMTGLELFSLIQSRWPKMAENAGFITGDAPSEATRMFLKRTGRPALLKPFTLDELESFVRRLAKGSQTD